MAFRSFLTSRTDIRSLSEVSVYVQVHVDEYEYEYEYAEALSADGAAS